ncbi:MAG TPA: PIN domain-containing protein [Polyangia bacterium]
MDTSVWVDYLRGRDPHVKIALDRLLDEDGVAVAAPVRVELLGGARKDQQPTLRRVLGAVPTFRPTDATWDRMESWALQATAKGHRFGVGDLLIAAIAADQDAPVWSLDSDFGAMAKLGFIRAYRPG